jgi:hypothetical protein
MRHGFPINWIDSMEGCGLRADMTPEITCYLVEVRGFEPLTSAVRRQRSTGLSYTPGIGLA